MIPKDMHDADFDFDHWLAGKYGEQRHSEERIAEPYLRLAFRAGWEAHAEEIVAARDG
jgi:hypothetical protein